MSSFELKAKWINEKHPVTLGQPALVRAVPVTKWRQREFQHDDRAATLPELREQDIQPPLERFGRVRAEDVVAADFREHKRGRINHLLGLTHCRRNVGA